MVIERGYRVLDHESILFPFLRSLPHLQSFRWSHFHRLVRNPTLHQLVACLRHSPLEHFTYWAPHQVSELVVTGPPRLKTLSVKLCVFKSQSQNSSLSFSVSNNAHVYDLIRPSFSTLVELEIYPGSVVVDLLPLRPVGSTLRKFVYGGNGFDPDILDTISDVFPHLTTLELTVWNRSRDFRWKVRNQLAFFLLTSSETSSLQAAYDQALAKNSKLQYLAVFAEDFLFCDSDDRWAHLDSECRNCVDQRVKATRVLAMVCTGLKRCWWKNRHAQFRFVVRVSLEENTLGQVQSVLFTDLNKYDDDSDDIFIVLP